MRRRTFLAAGALALAGACTERSSARSAVEAVLSPLRSPGPGRRVLLDEVLARRRSIRDFTTEPVAEEDISRLLWAAQGMTAGWGGRTAPSAGGLYPIELYVATSESLRRYVSAEHATIELAREDRRPLIADATNQDPARAAPVLIVITAITSRTAAKYGARAPRYVQLEAGHVCQNLLLEATALGLAAVPMGAFSDDVIRDAIEVAGDEQPLYVVPIGHPGT